MSRAEWRSEKRTKLFQMVKGRGVKVPEYPWQADDLSQFARNRAIREWLAR